MAQANPRWGAPRIHGELLKLGIDVSQATVAKYMGRRRQPPRRPGAPSCGITSPRSWRPISSWFRLRPTASCSSWCSSPTIGDAFGTSRSPHIRRRGGRPNNCVRPFRGTRRLAICSTIAITRSTMWEPRRRRWGLRTCSRHHAACIIATNGARPEHLSRYELDAHERRAPTARLNPAATTTRQPSDLP